MQTSYQNEHQIILKIFCPEADWRIMLTLIKIYFVQLIVRFFPGSLPFRHLLDYRRHGNIAPSNFLKRDSTCFSIQVLHVALGIHPTGSTFQSLESDTDRTEAVISGHCFLYLDWVLITVLPFSCHTARSPSGSLIYLFDLLLRGMPSVDDEC